jgi:hypothetical protein
MKSITFIVAGLLVTGICVAKEAALLPSTTPLPRHTQQVLVPKKDPLRDKPKPKLTIPRGG